MKNNNFCYCHGKEGITSKELKVAVEKGSGKGSSSFRFTGLQYLIQMQLFVFRLVPQLTKALRSYMSTLFYSKKNISSFFAFFKTTVS
jgi:hypothetical protein